ncbi:MAG: hypothetical protein QM696_04780 [Steroidobacteraceae bacterium]
MKHAGFSIRRLTVAAAAVAWMAAPAVWAQDAAKTHAGEFVKANDGGFTMTVGGQNEHPHKVTEQTHYMVNGKHASLKELKQGDHINVTTSGGVVTMVDATRP